MSRRTVTSPIPRLLPALAVAAACAALVVGCSSDPEPTAKKDKATTTTVASGDTTTTTRPPIDPESIEGGTQAYVDALVPMIEGSTGLSEADAAKAADCLAPRWVEIIGVEGFAAAGVAPDDFGDLDGGLERLGLDRATAEQMADAFDECDIDLRASAVAQFTADPAMTDEVKACIAEKVTLDAVKEGLIANLAGEPSDAAQFAEAQACLETEAPPAN